MTNEIFNIAIQIAKRLEQLQDVMNFHSNSGVNILTYAYKNYNNDYSLLPSWATNPILPLLAKHDAMIRQEIEQEIESLKKEIENLSAMPQRNPSITSIVRQISEQINRELNDRLPRKVGIMAVNHFNRNFREGGWNDNSLTPWQETIRQREGKGADRRRKPLISAAPHLSRSIEVRPRPRAVRIINPVEYARIYNEGGQFTTHPTVTPRM